MTYCYPYKRGTGWRSQGFRTNPNQGANGAGGHTGYDQAMDAGTQIYAPGDGIVRNSDWVSANYLDNPWWLTQMGGDCLVLDCFGPDGTTDTGPTFVFAHLSDSIAYVGQQVRKGELIALSGNTGTASTGPHLHAEALPPNWDFNNGVYGRVDPERYFTEWPDDIAGIAAMGSTITPIPEEDTLSQAEVDQLYSAMMTRAAQLEESLTKVINAAADAAPVRNWSYTNPNIPGGDAFQRLRDIPAQVLNQTFKLADGTVTNLAGILTAIHATPSAGTPADPTAVVHALRDQLNK